MLTTGFTILTLVNIYQVLTQLMLLVILMKDIIELRVLLKLQ